MTHVLMLIAIKCCSKCMQLFFQPPFLVMLPSCKHGRLRGAHNNSIKKLIITINIVGFLEKVTASLHSYIGLMFLFVGINYLYFIRYTYISSLILYDDALDNFQIYPQHKFFHPMISDLHYNMSVRWALKLLPKEYFH